MWGFTVRESWRSNRNCNILTPPCYDRQRCVFLVLLMPNRSPWGPLCWVLAFFTASYQQPLWSPNSIGVPEDPLGQVWLSLPQLVYNSVSNCNCNWNSNSNSTVLISVLTELYNSSSSTQLPTRSLKSHVWSSSSGNNCQAVHRSLSSDASVYESIMGFFSLSHFVSQFPPRRFPFLTAIGMCHFLPVHDLEWHFGSGRRSKYNTSHSG